jgi:hypothetical protein
MTPDVYTHNDKPVPAYHLLRLKIEHDEDCPNPFEDYDGAWILISFDRDYANSNRKDRRDRDDFKTTEYDEETDEETEIVDPDLAKKFDSGLAFTLYRRGDNWCINAHDTDLDDAAGLLLWEHDPSDLPSQDYNGRIKDAQSGLDEYNSWANGSCYGYVLSDSEDDEIDSCWGYIGDYIQEVIKDELVGPYLKEHGLTSVAYYQPYAQPTYNRTHLPADPDPHVLHVILSGDAAYMAP